MTEEQRKLEQMVVQLNQHQTQVDMLRTNLETIEAQMNQLAITGVTLDGVSKSNEGQEILIPIGSNSFVFAKIQNLQKVLIGIGSDVAVESSIEEAQERLGQQMRELREVAETLQNQYRSSLQKVEVLRAQVQESYNKMQKR